MRKFTKCIKFYEEHAAFIENNRMMGPNALWLIEILSEKMDLKPGMKVLDMGCGTGLTSIFLAKEFGVTVFANDLWISPSDNHNRFMEMGVADRVFALQAEAHALPYAEDFFDAAISVDAYHYFGTDELYFPQHFAKLVKSGGQFGIISPGIREEFVNGLTAGLETHWEPEMYSWHSAEWWRRHWEKTGLVEVGLADTLPDGKEIWRETADFDLHDADRENMLTMIMMIAEKK